jgi:hypothetical protein
LLSDRHVRSLAEGPHENIVDLPGRKFAHAAPMSKRAPRWTMAIAGTTR